MDNKIKSEREHFNKLAEKYSSQWWGSRTKTGQFREYNRVNLLMTEICDLDDIKVLDVGCSGGSLTFKLAEELKKVNKKAELYAVDISDKLIQLASDQNHFQNLHFLEGDIGAMPFTDESFDIIYGNAILHHLNLDKCLGEIKRVLKKNGKVIFFEPNLLNPEVFIEKKIKFIGKLLQNSPTETAFTPNSIRKELEKSDFRNIKVINFDFFHPLIPFVFVKKIGCVIKFLEKIPIIKNLSGSLFICGEK